MEKDIFSPKYNTWGKNNICEKVVGVEEYDFLLLKIYNPAKEGGW